MPQVIPGGRPRSSSDGDILDEEFCGTLVMNLSNRNYADESRRKTSFTNINSSNTSNSTNNLNSSDDSFDSGSKLSSRSQSSSRSGRKGLTFKSMRKAVSRVFVKDSKFNDSAVKKYENSNLSKVWTPDLRHLSNKPRITELSYSGTLSTARPLITKPKVVPKWTTTPGVVGIYNHGNNCFMNTVLQCLSNTDSFTEYFIRDFVKNDLKNSTNGKKGVFRSSHGEVTEQLANFLKCLWSGKYSSDVSKEFKAVVGKFNNQYKGDDQNDAQEFLLWLLDCIHEDVSTFAKKKVKPQKTPVGKSDKELASETASVNGESFILRLFQALHSSTLTCPTCGERSSTFDPYLCVSLPLPQRYLRVVYVIVVYLDYQDFQEVKMAFTLNQNDGIRELRGHVADDTRIPLQQVLLVQLKDDCFGATYTDEQPLSDVPENEVVYAIETHPDNASMNNSTQEFDSPTSQVLVIHVEMTDDKSTHSYRFGSPAMLQVRRDITWKSLQVEMLKKMRDSVCEEIFSKTQKLGNLFLLRVYDGRSRKFYLPSDVDMPLYSQYAERAYTINNDDSGPSHIKIIAEWDPETKSRVVVDDQEHIENSPSIAKVQNCPPGQGKVSLEECFRLYTQEEKLIGDDAWLCPHCKRQQQGTIKTLGLWSLPEILVLHLKRFKQTGPRRSKLNTLIDFPVDNLDMSSHLSHKIHGHITNPDDYIYDLMGVSNHYGNMMGGHYTAYCRNPIDGKWREYNDAKVRFLEGPVATREAYILFYQRRSLSKNVNQRLFTGDHWIYSLFLTHSDATGEISTLGKSANLNLEHTHQSQFSRSRSASPSTRRQINKGWNSHCLPTYSLTPPPARRFIMPYTNGKDFNDDSSSTSSLSLQNGNTNQRSRPKQRQSDSHSENIHKANSRESSSVRPRDNTRAQYNRNPDEDKEGFVSKNTLKPNPKSNIIRSQPQTLSRTTDVEMSPSFTANRHDSFGSNDFSSNNSKTVTHHSPVNSATVKSQATSPLSSNPASAFQMKHNGKSLSHSSKLHHDSLPLSNAENAGKKLAQIMKQDIMSRTNVNADTTEDQSSYVKSDSKNVGTNNSRGIARLKQINKENLVEVLLPQENTNDNSHNLDNFTSNAEIRGDEFKRNNLQSFSVRRGHRNTGSPLSTKDKIADPDLSVQSELKQKMPNETQLRKFRQKPEEHFEEKNGLLGYRRDHAFRFADDTAIWNSESTSSLLTHDVPRPSKYTTISRTYNTSQAGRFERASIPHSNTDHDIQYNSSSFGPPPSPTPPHSLREKQTFSHADASSLLSSSSSDYFTSSHITSREAHSTQSSAVSRQHSNHQNSLTSSGTQTLPRQAPSNKKNRYNFHPPREVCVVKIEPAQQNIPNNFTPCVRESSV